MSRSKAIPLLFLVLAVVYACGLAWGLPSEFSPAIDSPVPYSPLTFAAEYANPHIAEKYPAAQQLILLPFYGLVLALHWLGGNVSSLSASWPYGLSNPVPFFSHLILASRLVTLAMAVAVLAVVGRMALMVGASTAGAAIAVALLGTSGAFTYYAAVGNFDLPVTLWWSLALWSFLRYRESRRSRDLALCSTFCAAAVATKDPAVGLVAGVGLWLWLAPSERGAEDTAQKGLGPKTRVAARFASLAFVAYLLFAVIPQPWRWLAHARLLLSPGLLEEFVQVEPTFSGQVDLAIRSLEGITALLSPVGLLLATLGAAQLLYGGCRKVLGILLVPILSYYLLAIAPIGFVYVRFLLPAAVGLAPLVALGVTRALEAASRRGKIVQAAIGTILTATVIAQLALGAVPITAAKLSDVKRDLARDLPGLVPQGEPIIWFGGTTALPNADVYRRYPLVLPKGVSPPSRAISHVFDSTASSTASSPRYLLTEHTRANQEGAVLLRRWQLSPWIRRGVGGLPLHNEYRLYRLDGDPDATVPAP